MTDSHADAQKCAGYRATPNIQQSAEWIPPPYPNIPPAPSAAPVRPAQDPPGKNTLTATEGIQQKLPPPPKPVFPDPKEFKEQFPTPNVSKPAQDKSVEHIKPPGKPPAGPSHGPEIYHMQSLHGPRPAFPKVHTEDPTPTKPQTNRAPPPRPPLPAADQKTTDLKSRTNPLI